ncbi:MAG: hypothetical protein ACOCV2_14100 [Persicimonas sp.]
MTKSRYDMTEYRRIALAGLVAAAALLLSGCCSLFPTQQTVIDVKQHPEQEATIIQTYEEGCTYTGYRFWHCTREGDDLKCEETCGGDPECAENPGALAADRSVSAQSGSSKSKRQAKTEEDEEARNEDEGLDEDEALEEDEERDEGEEPTTDDRQE